MNIFLVTNEPFPNGMAATRRIICYAKSLSLQGDDVEVIIYHRTEVYGSPPKNKFGEGLIENIRYHYIGGTPLRGSNVVIRKWNDMMDMFRTLQYLKKRLSSGDVILMYCGDEFFLTHKLIKIAKNKNSVIVRDLCEYPFGTREDNKKSIFKRTKYIKHVFPKIDGTICISEALFEYAQRHHPTGHHIKVPILVETSKESNKQHHLRPYIFHGGTMYERKDAIISTMLAFGMACQKLNNQIDFILAGPKSPHKAELDSIISDLGINNNVIFLSQLPPNEIGAYQRGAFLAILNKNDNPQNHYGFSTKLGELLISGTPVITTTVGEANYWLKDGESAYIVEPNRPELITDKIIEAYNNDEERKKIAQKGKDIAKKYFSLEYQGSKLHAFFEKLTIMKSKLIK